MKPKQSAFLIWLCAAAALGGCGGGGSGDDSYAEEMPPQVTPPTQPTTVGFTSFSKRMYADGEADATWDLDSVTFTFDGDDDPTAYDDLLPPPAG